jgi:hypothetical protein
MLAVALATLAVALPQHGVVVPGRSFGGLPLGATSAEVEATWGRRHGRCHDCAPATWYFTYEPFQRRGAGVSFQASRADAFFTIWAPAGWHTDRGLVIGSQESRIARLYGSLPRTDCGSYSVLVLRRQATDSQLYVRNGKVWGFGLTRAGAPPCR